MTRDLTAFARGRLMAPAVGLMVASVVDVLAILAIVLFSLRISAGGSDDLTIRTAVSIVIGVASLVHAIALALGATRMFGLRSHRLAMAATVSRSGPAS